MCCTARDGCDVVSIFYFQRITLCPLSSLTLKTTHTNIAHHYTSQIHHTTHHRLAYENVKDIIACGFDMKKTFIFSDLDYIQVCIKVCLLASIIVCESIVCDHTPCRLFVIAYYFTSLPLSSATFPHHRTAHVPHGPEDPEGDHVQPGIHSFIFVCILFTCAAVLGDGESLCRDIICW